MESEKNKHQIYNLVIGLSGPYGSGCSSLAEEIVKIVNDWPGCCCKRIQVSDLIKYWHKKIINKDFKKPESDSTRREDLQSAGNELRRIRRDIIGLIVSHEIRILGEEIEKIEEADDIGTIVYVVDSLKNEHDLNSFRKIYKDEFLFYFVTANNEIRWRRMRDYKSWKEEEKYKFQEIDNIDSDQKLINPFVEDYGQQVKKLASYADYYFINNETREDLHRSTYRMICIIFGLNINQPTKDERSMHIAFSSANQSACLSRQVGAAIFTKDGNILAIGHNDVPKARGGLYSIEDGDFDHRCLNVGDRRCINDTNKEERFHNLSGAISISLKEYFEKILPNDATKDIVLASLEKRETYSEKNIFDSNAYNTIRLAVEKSEFKDATEYCRAVHAEMDALLTVCRNLSGSTIGSTVYVTTQPCHNCVKHLIAAGVERVVYIEPYPKSLGEELHSDAISLNPQHADAPSRKISFLPYQGLAPRRYHDMFDMDEKRKDKKGKMNYMGKQEKSFSPKFAHRVAKRSRIAINGVITDQISLNELQVTVTLASLNQEGDNEPTAQPNNNTTQPSDA